MKVTDGVLTGAIPLMCSGLESKPQRVRLQPFLSLCSRRPHAQEPTQFLDNIHHLRRDIIEQDLDLLEVANAFPEQPGARAAKIVRREFTHLRLLASAHLSAVRDLHEAIARNMCVRLRACS